MRATVTTIVERVRRGFKPANRRPAPQDVSDESSELTQVGTTWEQLAQIDPLWAVLSEPDKKGRRWVAEEFLASGEAEVANLLADLEKLGVSAHGEKRSTSAAVPVDCRSRRPPFRPRDVH